MKDEVGKDAISSAGLIIAKAADGDVNSFVSRVAPDLSSDIYYSISKEAINAVNNINLPVEIIKANWMFSPYALKDLYVYLVGAINSSRLSEVIPVNPLEIKAKSWGFYGKIFDILFMCLNGYKARYGSKIARPAVMWMEGKPYPAIISIMIAKKKKEIDDARRKEEMLFKLNPSHKKKNIKDVDVNKIIKDTFDLIEDDVRFKLVQMGKAYIDLLRHSLVESRLQSHLATIYDFSLALEIGVSSETGRSFIELGLSRIAATALQDVIPDSSLTVDQARSMLRTFKPEDSSLSPVIRDELERLGLITLEM